MTTKHGDQAQAAENDDPGLPGIQNWRTVYWLVAGSFVLWVVLLAALTGVFS